VELTLRHLCEFRRNNTFKTHLAELQPEL